MLLILIILLFIFVLSFIALGVTIGVLFLSSGSIDTCRKKRLSADETDSHGNKLSRDNPERLEPVIPAVPDPEKKQRYEEERRAFDTCMKYNSEMAYECCGKI